MNNVCLTGRITKEPELKTTQTNKSFITFTIAVDRGFKDDSGNYITDFINCVAWNNQAEFIYKYVQKGNLIEITGSIQTRTYQKTNGDNRTVTEVIVDNVKNLTPKSSNEKAEEQEEEKSFNPSFNNYDDDDLPF